MARTAAVQRGNGWGGDASAEPDRPSPARPRIRRGAYTRQVGVSGAAGWAFISPSFIGILVFTFIPSVLVILLSLAHWDLISGFKGITWAGLTNYRSVFNSSSFWHGLGLTAEFVGVTVPATLVLALGMAVALESGVVGARALRVILLIPFIINQVAVANIWVTLYFPQAGLINYYLQKLGVQNPPDWLASETWALPALMIMAVWGGVGFATLFYSAGLQNISGELHEAAMLDGASSWKRFRRITVPLLSPTTFFLVLVNLIIGSQSFGLVNLMTQGGPGTATNVLSYQIYQDAFQYNEYGFASALALVMFVFVMLVVGGIWLASRRHIFYR